MRPKRTPTTPCWIWSRALNSGGYGSVSGDNAHRYVYERLIGPIPEGLELDHLCRTRGCVNPDHLEPVTHAVNMERALMSGKLSPEAARAIRSEHGRGVAQRVLALQYGVSTEAIRLVIVGKTYRNA